ncbi:DUF5663 domain-containing protein [Streptomyces sp. NPDC054940]
MIVLDDALLQKIGLGDLPSPHKKLMLSYIYDVLEQRVGLAFAAEMNDEEFEEFEAFIDANDEAGAMSWLSDKRPDYPQVVAQEFERLKEELGAQADALASVSARYTATVGPSAVHRAEGGDDVAQGLSIPGQVGASE